LELIFTKHLVSTLLHRQILRRDLLVVDSLLFLQVLLFAHYLHFP
jgi:hypothetical protein